MFLLPPNIIPKHFAVGQLLVPDETVVKKLVNNPVKQSNVPVATNNPESEAPTATNSAKIEGKNSHLDFSFFRCLLLISSVQQVIDPTTEGTPVFHMDAIPPPDSVSPINAEPLTDVNNPVKLTAKDLLAIMSREFQREKEIPN